jgi:hypothetical protein
VVEGSGDEVSGDACMSARQHAGDGGEQGARSFIVTDASSNMSFSLEPRGSATLRMRIDPRGAFGFTQETITRISRVE